MDNRENSLSFSPYVVYYDRWKKYLNSYGLIGAEEYYSWAKYCENPPERKLDRALPHSNISMFPRRVIPDTDAIFAAVQLHCVEEMIDKLEPEEILKFLRRFMFENEIPQVIEHIERPIINEIIVCIDIAFSISIPQSPYKPGYLDVFVDLLAAAKDSDSVGNIETLKYAILDVSFYEYPTRERAAKLIKPYCKSSWRYEWLTEKDSEISDVAREALTFDLIASETSKEAEQRREKEKEAYRKAFIDALDEVNRWRRENKNESDR